MTKIHAGKIYRLMWVNQCHNPPIWEWFTQPIYGDLGNRQQISMQNDRNSESVHFAGKNL
jgi:hypothetical protein